MLPPTTSRKPSPSRSLAAVMLPAVLMLVVARFSHTVVPAEFTNWRRETIAWRDSAVLYDLDGGTFLYTRTGPSVYVRAAIVVEQVAGDQAILAEGPPPGTLVVTVGGVELYGVETGLGQ